MKRGTAIWLLALSLSLPVELQAFTATGDARFGSRPYTAEDSLFWDGHCVLQYKASGVGTNKPAKVDTWKRPDGDEFVVEYDYKSGSNNYSGVYFVQFVMEGGFAIGDTFTVALDANNSTIATGPVTVTVTAADLAAFSPEDAKTCVK